MLQEFLSSISPDSILQTVESILSDSSSYLPASLGISSIVQLSLFAIGLLLALGIVFRIFFGKHCNANQAVSASVGILFIYALTIFIYSVNPFNFAQYLSPLPFALFRRDILIVVPFSGTEYPFLCTQILSLIILSFIVHVLDFLLPTGKSLWTWLLFRSLSIVLAIFFNLAVLLAMNTFLPEGIAAYAPTVLLAVLAVALLIGLFNPLLCIIFTVINPIFGLLYTFFFSNAIGKQLTKSVLSTGILCCLFFAMEYLGYTVIDITQSSVLMNLPIGILLLFLWYVFDYKL